MAEALCVAGPHRTLMSERPTATAASAGINKIPAMAAEPRVLPLRAPSGEIQWTIVELQGTLEAKAASLDGFHLGDLFERRVSVPSRPPRPRRLPAPPRNC